MSADRRPGHDELERFYDRQRRQILERAEAERAIAPEDVDRFYARQGAELLARIAAEGATPGQAARRGAARWRLYGGLAAAALLTVVFAPILLPDRTPPPQPVEPPSLGRMIVEEAVDQEEALPLQAFGSWSGAFDDSGDAAPGDVSDDRTFTSLSWLLEGEAADTGGAEEQPLPAFLQPYGLWSEDDHAEFIDTSA